VADKLSDFYRREVQPDAEAAQNLNTLQETTSPATLDQEHDMKFQDLPQKQDQTTIEVNSVPPTPFLELNDPGFQNQSPGRAITRN